LSREGLDGAEQQPYNDSTAILTQKNAANIEILKEEIDKCKGIQSILTDLSNQVQTIKGQVNAMNESKLDSKLPDNYNAAETSKNINKIDTTSTFDV